MDFKTIAVMKSARGLSCSVTIFN